MNVMEKYQFWCEDVYFDKDTQKKLLELAGNEKEIEDRFYKDLEFGTGGLRGVLGEGTNRMNIYTVRKATQGLANVIIKAEGKEKGVAIAYDSRNMSPEFAKEAACCLCANGITTYLFDTLHPTPMLSFAVRELHCIAGIVITASHNPAEYNGYKVYWEDGAQITFPKDKEIITEVNSITDFNVVKMMDEKVAVDTGILKYIGEEIDSAYIAELKKLVLNPEVIKKQSNSLRIVYSPLHGAGNLPVRRILEELGFEQVYVVKEQEMPDGDFPTISYPNPEDPKAFALALKLAKEVRADIILATDPDADRLGIYAKNIHTGEYEAFTGNMSGILLCEYQMSQRKEKQILPENGAIVTTIVSGNMAKAVAKEYQVELIETLTGFKYIGEQIKLFEQTQKHEFLFGFEESYGCLIGTYARDKDAVVAVMALCEAAAYYKSQGITLCQQMENLYEKYGFYKEDLLTVTLKGQDGAKQIQTIMERIRTNPPRLIGDHKVIGFRDYETDQLIDYEKDITGTTGLPKSNVLYFEFEQDGWCCIRPSGTEPKIKFYIGVKGSGLEEAENQLMKLKESVNEFL